MTQEIAIEVNDLTKRFGAVTAVDGLSFVAKPGRVTGFLGPNGAGKSTTLRAVVGLARPTSGSTTIGGAPYASLQQPGTTVGVHLEAAFHPGRTGRDHLRTFAPLVGAADARCDAVLASVGLTDAANRRVGGYSLGMRQRLGLATALLGDPRVLVLDESANGLDPAGIKWLREFLREFAGKGGTVLLSSHLLTEVQQTVDDVVIIAGGTLRHQSTLEELRAMVHSAVTLRSPNHSGLKDFVKARFAKQGTVPTPGEAVILGVSKADVGAAAFADALEVHELSAAGESLEDVFLRLTATEVAA